MAEGEQEVTALCVLQVAVVFCLWGTEVSRAYVFQASRPDGGDSPPTHTKGDRASDWMVTPVCKGTVHVSPEPSSFFSIADSSLLTLDDHE